MYKIFIDTNKYLDFYRFKEDNKEILDKIADSNRIVITNQVIREFERNRNIELKRLLEKVQSKEKSIDNNICNIEPVGIFSNMISKIDKDNIELIKSIKDNIKPLEEKILNLLKDDNSDDVLLAFKKIINNKKTLIIKDDDKCYENAVKRNMLGGIPRSDKSGYKALTICDEYIWECLLKHSRSDLIFITRDDTYINNSTLLAEEYNSITGKKIEFYSLFSDALNRLGEKISEEAIEKERQEQDYFQSLERISNITNIDISQVEKELYSLSMIENDVIRLRFGLIDGYFKTLEETGDILGLSKEEVRLIEAKAMHKMRNRNNMKQY